MQIKTKVVSCHTADSKPVKQEVNGTVILPLLVFPDLVFIVDVVSHVQRPLLIARVVIVVIAVGVVVVAVVAALTACGSYSNSCRYSCSYSFSYIIAMVVELVVFVVLLVDCMEAILVDANIVIETVAVEVAMVDIVIERLLVILSHSFIVEVQESMPKA